MELRDYQLSARTALWDFIFRRPGNPIVAMPTGTGKSFAIADTCYCADYYIPGARVVVATHSKELVKGNSEALREYFPGANVGIYSASMKRKDTPANHQFMFVGIDSVYKRAAEFGHVSLLIIDECHLVDSKDGTRYALFIAGLMAVNPGLRIIGYSATAWRTKTGALAATGLFTDVCYDDCTLDRYNWYERQGYLARLVGKATDTVIDVSEVRTSGGDFNVHDLELATDRRVTKLILEESADIGFQRNHWLIYGSTIGHVEMITEMANNMGIPCAAIHSKMNEDREPKIEMLKAGKLRALASQGVLTTGVNIPCVDLIVQGRPTKSSSLHVQIMGRGTRPVFAPGFDLRTAEGRLAAQQAGPKQDCLFLDYARNIERLGPINDPYIPDGKKKGGGGGGGFGMAPTRLCKAELLNTNGLLCNKYSHASKACCEHCGAEFPIGNKLLVSASNAAPVANAEPVYEVYNVDVVSYHAHKTRGGGQCLRVTYHAGFRSISEYVHCESQVGAEPHRRAMIWLNERGFNTEFPLVKTSDVMKEITRFRQVRRIRVHVNRKYPEVVGVEFVDGNKSILDSNAAVNLKFA
jgi:DNA repair protein RadD